MQIGRVKEIVGSTVNPEHARLAIIFVPCSTSGTYSSDVYDKISARWTKVQFDYRSRFINRDNFKLGEIITTSVKSDIWVCQAICLNDKGKLDKLAMESCIKKLITLGSYEGGYIHASQLTLKSFPALKKALVASIPQEGLNLYCYSDDEQELVKR